MQSSGATSVAERRLASRRLRARRLHPRALLPRRPRRRRRVVVRPLVLVVVGLVRVQDWHHEGSAPTPTAATSSSEASWSSRSALLPMPNRPVVAAAPAAEAKLNSRTESEQTGRKHPSSSSSHLRRWLLGVAGCAWACGDGEDPVCADLCRDEVEDGSVHGGKKRSTEADEMLLRRTSKPTAVEDVTTVSAMPSKRADDSDGDAFLAETTTQRSLQLAEPARRRASTSSELSMRILNPTTNALFDERPRESSDMFHPAPAGQGSTLVPAKQSSAFTIVAGSTTQGGAASAAGGGRGSLDTPYRTCGSRRDYGSDADDAAPSELECTYPPSEASVVWSVVTAEGAASGNFSSAASGCYYYINDADDDEVWRPRHTAGGAKRSRPRRNRSRINGGGLLMGCISKRAIDAIGPPRTCAHRPEVEPATVARVRGPDVTQRR